MKIIGITGGIGSGKTTFAKLIEHKGYPVYYSDYRAKCLMNKDITIKEKLIQWYGSGIYGSNGLDRKKLAQIIFSNPDELSRVNGLVHPIVFADFEQWKNQQSSDFIFKESAILFESGADKYCDWVVTVSSPLEFRIKRVMERDNLSRDEIEQRISKQWNDKQRASKADFIINNNKSIKELEIETEKFLIKLLKFLDK